MIGYLLLMATIGVAAIIAGMYLIYHHRDIFFAKHSHASISV